MLLDTAGDGMIGHALVSNNTDKPTEDFDEICQELWHCRYHEEIIRVCLTWSKAHPMQEVNRTSCKVCLDDVCDIGNVNPSGCGISADHDAPLPELTTPAWSQPFALTG